MRFVIYFLILIVFLSFNNMTAQQPISTQEIGTINVVNVRKNVINMNPIGQLVNQYNIRESYLNDGVFISVDPSFIDWDSDGLMDVYINIAGNPDEGVLHGLLIQNENNTFDVDSRFHSYSLSDGSRINKNIGDLDNDGDLDIFYATANYHGSLNPPPSWYNEQCPYNTPDKIYFNNSDGFDEFILNNYDVGPDGCPINHFDTLVYDIDGDLINEVLIGGYTRWDILNDQYQSESDGLHVRYFDINEDQEVSVRFSFNLEEMGGVRLILQSINEVNGKIYVPLFVKKFRNNITGYEGLRTIDFRDNCPNDDDCTYFNEYYIAVYPNKSSLLTQNYERIRINFDENRGMAGEYESFFVFDIDNDNELEFILNSTSYNDQGGGTTENIGLHVFESDGTNVTENWLGDLSLNPSVLENENEPLYSGADSSNGINVVDINNDGLVDIIPVNGWYTTDDYDTERRYSENFKHIIFINDRGKRFKPYYLEFPSEHYNSAGLINSNGAFGGFKYVHDIDNDGEYEIIQIRVWYEREFPNFDIVELNFDDFDNDGDGIINSIDQFPNDPYSSQEDSNGNPIFSLSKRNFLISLENLSCIGENDGSISISVEDEDLNYTLRVNGENSLNLNSTDGYQQTLSNLSPGTYQLCFTVEGESSYSQCFDINITEPAPLSAYSKVDKVGKSISFSLDGSDRYTIVHNGVERVFNVSNPEIQLKKGINFIEVKTDKLCQGTYTEEVFVSEKVEFYPNPTTDVVNLFIHGKDKTVDIKIVDRDGNIIGTSCRDIQSNRKVQVDIEQYPKGVYLIQAKGETVQKTIKIIRE